MAKQTPQYKPNLADQKAIKEVQDSIEAGKRWHNAFAKKVERRYDAWRGLLPENVDAAKPKGWRSNQHPPYLINIVEGMLSSLEDPNSTWKVFPRAIPEMGIEQALSASDNAELASALLSHQMRIDEFNSKIGPLAHQDLIAGLTVGKIHWLKQRVERTGWDENAELIYDENGSSIDVATKLEKVKDWVTLRDDPTLEVRDVRDWMYPESATSLETAPWVIDRTYVTYETLERMEDLGIYKNVKYLRETRPDESNADPSAVRDRERRLRNVDRTKGLIEVVERWSPTGVATIGNGHVLLRNRTTPFWHGRKPFVVCSAIPDLFQIPGVSIIEGLASMQEMLWTLTNLRLDATRIAASVITMIRGDVDNAEDYEWAPEAQWIVPDPNAVKTLDMSAVSAAAASTLQAEGILRGDIQNVMVSLPFTGGSQSQTIAGSDTATGVSIITNIAQAILARRKGHYQRLEGKVGQMFLELDQQFLPEEKLVEILGEENARRYINVSKLDIKGIWDVEVEATGESMMRQEERAENGALLTMIMQNAAIMKQAGVGFNLRAAWERLFKSYGITNPAIMFEAEQSQGAPQGAPPTPPGEESMIDQMAGQMSPGGVTNESLAAGPTSPSSPVTMSPSAPMQQALARNGAGRSV